MIWERKYGNVYRKPIFKNETNIFEKLDAQNFSDQLFHLLNNFSLLYTVVVLIAPNLARLTLASLMY